MEFRRLCVCASVRLCVCASTLTIVNNCDLVKKNTFESAKVEILLILVPTNKNIFSYFSNASKTKYDPSVFFFEKGFFMSQKRVFFVKNIE